MRQITILLSSLALLFSFGQATALAQTPAPPPSIPEATEPALPEGGDAHLLPAVPVSNIQVFSVSDSAVTGSFEVQNQSENLIGDLNYQISVMDPAPELKENQIIADTATVHDRKIYTEKISLSPSERKTVVFSYAPPSLPKGEYRLRIRVITSKAIGLGWEDKSIQLGSAKEYVYITPSNIEVGEQKTAPMGGVNVDPKTQIKFHYAAENKTKKAVSGTPTLDIYNLDITGEKITTIKGTDISITPGLTAFEMTTETPEKPGSYYATITIKKGDLVISSLSQFRFVVKGNSARIVAAEFYELTNTSAKVQVSMVGPADRENSLEAYVKTYLYDGTKEVANKKSGKIDLTATGAVTGYVNFDLSNRLSDPQAKIQLVDAGDNVLDEYLLKVSGETPKKDFPKLDESRVVKSATPIITSPSNRNLWNLIAAIVIMMVIFAATVTYFIWKRSKKVGKLITISVLVTVFFVGLPLLKFFVPKVVAAPAATYIPTSISAGQGQVYMYDRMVWAYINRPIHNGYEPNRTRVTFQFDVYMVHCMNATESDRYYIDNLRIGGKHSESTYLNNYDFNSVWQILATNPAGHRYGRGDSCSGAWVLNPQTNHGEYLCPPTANLTGTLNIPVAGDSATLRIRAYKFSESGGWDIRGSFGAYLFVSFAQPANVALYTKNYLTDTYGTSATAHTGTTELKWDVSGSVTSCTASGASSWNGAVATAATNTASVALPPGTHTLNISCTGSGGTSPTSSVVVKVPIPAVSVPTASISASPASITEGETSVITWTSNATKCDRTDGNPDWQALYQPVSGTKMMGPMATGTYPLSVTCTNIPGTLKPLAYKNGANGLSLALYDPANARFYLRDSLRGNTVTSVGFGDPNLIPLMGDWNGDGIQTIGVYNQTSSLFYLRNSNTPGKADVIFGYGTPNIGLIPLVGKWGSYSYDSVGLYYPADAGYYLRNTLTSGNADISFGYGWVQPSGKPALVPFAGDWNGDGIATIGFYDPSTATWYLRNSNTAGNADMTFLYGGADSIPAVADWNGDGTVTGAVYYPVDATASGHWYIRNDFVGGAATDVIIFGGTIAKANLNLVVTGRPPVMCKTQNGTKTFGPIDAGQVVSLTGYNGPAGTNYSWRLDGTPYASGETIQFTAPSIDHDQSYSLAVLGDKTSGTDACTVQVKAAPRPDTTCSPANSGPIYPGQSVEVTGGPINTNYSFAIRNLTRGGSSGATITPIGNNKARFTPSDAGDYEVVVNSPNTTGNASCRIGVKLKSFLPFMREL